jgi:hypothetical protein
VSDKSWKAMKGHFKTMPSHTPKGKKAVDKKRECTQEGGGQEGSEQYGNGQGSNGDIG